MKTLYLVDVSSMYFRAFYAVRPLTNKKGLPTNALYGFMSMAVKLLKDVRPDYMAFCFDRKEPSFRKDIYPDYKANRSEMPADLVPQVPYIRKLSEGLGIPCFDKIGFEADDIIGALTHWARKNGLQVVIVSGDKDFAQLVGPFVTMYDTMKEQKYDRSGVVEKWGVEPEQVVDFMALTGDSSDNIPGVSGIGPKGAQKLLAEFKTLDNLYANLDRVQNAALKKKLEADRASAFLSRDLVRITEDVGIPFKLEDLKLHDAPEGELKSLLEELEFKSFERRIFGSTPTEPPAAAATPTSEVNTPQTLLESEEPQGSHVEQDITPEELKRKIPSGSLVWGISADRGTYIGFQNHVFRLRGYLEEFRPVLSQLQLKWKGFDLKTFWHSLGISPGSVEWDGALASYVVRAGEVEPFHETYQKNTGFALPELPNGVQLLEAHLKLETVLKQKLEEQRGERVLVELEQPLEPILYEMEKRGVFIDIEQLRVLSRQVTQEIQDVEKLIFESTGHTFNLTSPKQLADVLFNKLKMPVARKTKTGYSTDSDVLLKLSKDYPICLQVIEHRELSKLKSTYLDALPLLVNPETGRLHSHFNQTVTTTGRLSSTNPNLQNIPIRTPRGALIRKAFAAPEGKCLISADYSQIELRILAHISEDPGLTEAFARDLDIHAATAAQVFGVDVAAVTSEQRRIAKAVNFGIAYGMSPFGLSENLRISVEEATSIIKTYFIRFSRVRDYMNDTIETAKRQGYVETTFGRRRYLPELSSKNGAIRKFGERAAINAPMQGTASDIVKKAMIDVDPLVPGGLVLQVHDELVFEVEISKAEGFRSLIKTSMESVVKLNVPLKVNVAVGKDWDSAH